MLVRVTWIVCELGGKWPYSCCFVGGCCVQNLFKIAQNNFVLFPCSFFSEHFVRVQMVKTLKKKTDLKKQVINIWTNERDI